MKDRRKIFVRKSILLLLCLVAVLILNKQKACAEEAGFSITLDMEKQQMVLTGTEDKEFMVSFPKVTVTKKEGVRQIKSVKETTWNVYTSSKAIVDLSNVNPTKETYIEIKGNKNDIPVLLNFVPAYTKLRGKFVEANDETKARISVTTGTGTAAEEIDAAKLQFRTEGGSWKRYDGIDITPYTMNGATLYFRVNNSYVSNYSTTRALKDFSRLEIPGEKHSYRLYGEVEGFCSSEVKVKVKKLGNAPKATADYDKLIYKFRGGTSYRIIQDNNYSTPWVQGSKYTTYALVPRNGKGGVLEVRTDATKTKPASKIARYEFRGIRAIQESLTPTADTLVTDNAVVEGGVKVLEVEDVFKRGSTTITEGINIKNTSKTYFEVLFSSECVTSTSGLLGLAQVRSGVTKIYPEKEKVFKGKKYNGQYVYIRYAADKKNLDWASDYILLGKVKYME